VTVALNAHPPHAGKPLSLATLKNTSAGNHLLSLRASLS